MDDLTKEELISLLKTKEEKESEESPSPEKCIYKPVRGNQTECTSNATTPYGFCKKHSRTVQARKAREKWEELNKPPEPPKEEELQQETPPKEVSEKVEERLSRLEKQTKALSKKKKQTRKGERKPVVRKKVITPNMWGRYEDPETHIVFDPTAKKTFAYGVQAKNGDLLGLGPREISICKNNGWDYADPVTGDSESEGDSEDSSESEGESERESSDSEYSSEGELEYSSLEEYSEESSESE